MGKRMKDKYGRTIDYMRISITDRCNLRCRYCMPDGIDTVPMKDILTYEEIQSVCYAAARAGINRLKITGGEPLVRKDCAKLVGMLKQIPGIRQVTMTTNGVLLDQYLPQLLENGLDAVNISLDTLSAQTYEKITGKAELSRVLSNIRLAEQTGLQIKINCVLLKGINDDEWQQLAELTKELQADVRFIEMMPIGYGANFTPVYNETVLQKLYEIDSGIERDERIHGNGPAVYYKMKGAKGSIGFISAMHGKFCGRCNRLRITSTGKLKPCLCYADGADLKCILRGNTSKDEISERLYLAFVQAIGIKPGMHRFEEMDGVTEKGRMAQIGG